MQENEDVLILLSIIQAGKQPIQWLINKPDLWRFEKFHIFSVKTCYSFLLSFSLQADLDHDTQRVINDLWQLAIPTKVEVFG